jgi:small subunit ribosomal protein S21
MRAIFNKAMDRNMEPAPAAVKQMRRVQCFAFTARWPGAKKVRTRCGNGCRRQPPWWRRAPVQVLVRDNNVDQALRALKKKMQREGVFREMKLRRSYEKPSERRAREKAEAVRRYRKLLRKRMEREGY